MNTDELKTMLENTTCGWKMKAEGIKNLSIKFEELPEWQQAALPENYKLAHTVLLAFGLSLANLLIELGVVERISEEEE